MTGVNLAAAKVAAPRPSATRNHTAADYGLPTAVCRVSKLREQAAKASRRKGLHPHSTLKTGSVPHNRVADYTFDVSHDRTR